MYAGSGAQLNPLYSLMGAVLGTALVCAVLLWAFSHPLPSIPVEIMHLSLVAAPVAQPKRVVLSPGARAHAPLPKTITRPVTAKPLVIRKPIRSYPPRRLRLWT